MTKRVKWSISGAAVVAVALILGLTAAKRGNKGVEVRVEPVERRDLVASVTASGQIRPQTKVDLSADVSGRIVRLAVREGQMVARGQFLLQIDPEQATAAVDRAQASLASARAQEAQAQANLIQSEKNYERSAAIKKQNAQLISDEQLDQLKTAFEVNRSLLDAATHAVGQAQAAVRDARNSLGKTTIYAPMAGRVTRLNVEAGGTPLPRPFHQAR